MESSERDIGTRSCSPSQQFRPKSPCPAQFQFRVCEKLCNLVITHGADEICIPVIRIITVNEKAHIKEFRHGFKTVTDAKVLDFIDNLAEGIDCKMFLGSLATKIDVGNNITVSSYLIKAVVEKHPITVSTFASAITDMRNFLLTSPRHPIVSRRYTSSEDMSCMQVD